MGSAVSVIAHLEEEAAGVAEAAEEGAGPSGRTRKTEEGSHTAYRYWDVRVRDTVVAAETEARGQRATMMDLASAGASICIYCSRGASCDACKFPSGQVV